MARPQVQVAYDRARISRGERLIQITLYTVLSIGAFTTVFPFLWMIFTSLKPSWEVYAFAFLPQAPTMDNYKTLLQETLFLRWYYNSLVVVFFSTLSVAFFDTLVGYTLAKLQFRFKNIIFVAILSTMMIPTEMLVIPWYIMSVNFSWSNTSWGIMFPGMITAFGVFLMRQFFLSVPNDLLDAGRLDGVSEFGLFYKVALPQVKPALSALIIFNFLGNWNAFLWPMIAVDRAAMRTLPVGLAFFSNEVITQWELIMAGATAGVIPILIVFAIFQKQIIQGVVLTGLKG